MRTTCYIPTYVNLNVYKYDWVFSYLFTHTVTQIGYGHQSISLVVVTTFFPWLSIILLLYVLLLLNPQIWCMRNKHFTGNIAVIASGL